MPQFGHFPALGGESTSFLQTSDCFQLGPSRGLRLGRAFGGVGTLLHHPLSSRAFEIGSSRFFFPLDFFLHLGLEVLCRLDRRRNGAAAQQAQTEKECFHPPLFELSR